MITICRFIGEFPFRDENNFLVKMRVTAGRVLIYFKFKPCRFNAIFRNILSTEKFPRIVSNSFELNLI